MYYRPYGFDLSDACGTIQCSNIETSHTSAVTGVLVGRVLACVINLSGLVMRAPQLWVDEMCVSDASRCENTECP